MSTIQYIDLLCVFASTMISCWCWDKDLVLFSGLNAGAALVNAVAIIRFLA